jgi:hypothetical protein
MPVIVPMIKIQGQYISLLEWIYQPQTRKEIVICYTKEE